MKNTIEIVIPVYNGEKTLGLLTEGIYEHLQEYPVKVLFVDDASLDDSRQVIRGLQKRFPGVRSLFLKENHGQQQALKKGLAQISEDCDYVVTMDDDLQNPPELLPQLLKKIREGWDLVYATPVQLQTPFYRQVGSRMRDVLFSSLLGKPRGVSISSYRVMNKDLAENVAAAAGPFFYFSAEAFRHPIRATHISYSFVPRIHGSSSYNLKKLIHLYGGIVYHYVIRGGK